MLPQPERVHGGEAGLLVHAVVPGVEAVKIRSSNSTNDVSQKKYFKVLGKLEKKLRR